MSLSIGTYCNGLHLMVNRDKYLPEQREAAAAAVIERGTDYARVVELARAGELTTPTGDPVPPFDPPRETIRAWVKRQRARASGRAASPLAEKPHRDAVEQLRRRLVGASDALLRDMENQLRKKASTVDPERLRQIGRAVREIAALPGPSDPRPLAPGGKANGVQNGHDTKPGPKGLANSILSDMRQEQAVPDAYNTARDVGQPATQERKGAARDDEESTGDGAPGSLALELAEHLARSS